MIYLDNAATTYPKPECVYLALDRANREFGFNSGRGSYKKAREVSKIIDETRELLAKNVNADAKNVIFMPSSTISLNTIIFGIDWNEGDNVFVSPFEHNAIMRPLEEIRKNKHINIEVIPFNHETWEVEEELDDLFTLKKPRCVLCSSRSNVTGYNLPYENIFKISKEYGAINVLDASQSFGIDAINDRNLDFVVFAGHKSLYSSFGIAGFINKNNIFLKNHFFGGTGSDSLNLNMPEAGTARFEAGSMNIIAICGLNESIKWINETNVAAKEKELFNYLYGQLAKIKKAVLYLPSDVDKCSGIISFNINGYNSEEVGTILDEEFDICVRTGYHCSPLIHDFIGSKEYQGTVRVSLNYFNTKDQINELIKALETL